MPSPPPQALDPSAINTTPATLPGSPATDAAAASSAYRTRSAVSLGPVAKTTPCRRCLVIRGMVHTVTAGCESGTAPLTVGGDQRDRCKIDAPARFMVYIKCRSLLRLVGELEASGRACRFGRCPRQTDRACTPSRESNCDRSLRPSESSRGALASIVHELRARLG